ncbi:potassium channel subfamily K member 9 [Nematostella vectensis]|nr:potassium channel subfamily K member 9 [Nematostella vectensis]
MTEVESRMKDQEMRRSRCCRPSKLVQNMLFRLVIYLVFTFIGAAIFVYVENDPLDEDRYRKEVETAKKNINESLTELRNNEEFICAYQNKTNEDLVEFAKTVLQTAARLPEKPDKWKLSRGLQLTFEICTTIGYGSTPPKTQAGRILCIFYTIIGIPIFLIFLKSLGEVLNRTITKAVSWLEKKILKRDELKNPELKVLIGFSVALLITVLVTASDLKEQDLTYADKVYAVIITFTTVGFGDIMLTSDVQIIIGLSLLSTVLDGIGCYMEKLDEVRRNRGKNVCCKCFGKKRASDEDDAYGMDNAGKEIEEPQDPAKVEDIEKERQT